MKAAVLVGPSTFDLRTVEIPNKIKDWVKVKVAACGICGSDLAIYDRSPPIPKFWPGHEISGYVGKETVVVNPLIACGTCNNCQTDRVTICQNTQMISNHLPGGFAEFVYAPPANVLPIGVGVKEATFVEPLACAQHAVSVAGDMGNKTVRIIGGGGIGLLILQLVRMNSVKQVELIARYNHQQDLANKLGSFKLNEPPNITIIAAGGDGSALQKAVDENIEGGKIIALGNIYHSRHLNLKWLVEHELSVIGSQRYTNKDFKKAIQLIEGGKVNVKELITHEFSLEDITTAYNVSLNKVTYRSIKVLVAP